MAKFRTNSREFIAQMDRLAEQLLAEQLVLFHKKVVLELLRRIVLKTPVDTGRARGNWQIEIGKYPTKLIDIGAQNRDEKGRFRAGRVTRPPGQIIREANATLRSLRPFQVVYIANNVEYISYLENGSSKQAPQGMVGVSLQEVNNALGGLSFE